VDSLYLLLPLSVLLVLVLIGLFAWAIHHGQFDDLEREGWRVLEATDSLHEPHAEDRPVESSRTLDPAQFGTAQLPPTIDR
jgi:cbb3-type cytochrome oxidase maturation protein